MNVMKKQFPYSILRIRLAVALCACAVITTTTMRARAELPSGGDALPRSATVAAQTDEEPFIRFSRGGRFVKRRIGRGRRTPRGFTIEAEYPQIIGSRDARVRSFNERVRAFVVRELDSVTARLRERRTEMGLNQSPNEYHEVGYNVMYASDDLISIVFGVEGYAQGAAHPYHYPLVFNYDLNRNRVMQLADLFLPGNGYLQTISRYSIADLERQWREDGGGLTLDEMWARGAQPTTENYRNWAVTRTHLVVMFPEYQVAPYVAGPQRVDIPYDALRDVLNPRRGATASLLRR